MNKIVLSCTCQVVACRRLIKMRNILHIQKKHYIFVIDLRRAGQYLVSYFPTALRRNIKHKRGSNSPEKKLMARPSLLIIGADPDLRSILASELAGRDIDPVWVDDLAAGRAALKQGRPNAALIDFGPLGAGALELISEISAVQQNIPIVTVLTEDDLRIRVEAARRGTRMLLQKPISGSELG